MEQKTILDGIDSDLMAEVVTRRDALRDFGKLGARFASIASAPVALGLMAKAAVAQTSALPQQIVDVLNFALTLEELEAEFYKQALASGVVRADVRPLFEIISEHETAHVAVLRSVLGSQAIAKPTFRSFALTPYGNTLTQFGAFMAASQLFEDTGVRAYKGQAGNLISNDTVLTAALRIHSVEARHAALVRSIRGLKPVVTNATGPEFGADLVYAREETGTQLGVNVASVSRKPDYIAWEAFDEPLTKEEVIAIVRPYIVGL